MKYLETKMVDKPDICQGHFNGGEHVFLECESEKWQTISVKLPNGEFVTFAFIPSGSVGNEMESVDIHSTVGQKFKYKPTDAEDDIHFVQHAVGFSRYGDTIDTRTAGKPTGLLTLLLHKHHHEIKK